MVEDFDINFFDYDNNKLVKTFFNMIFQNGFFPLTQRATRVTRAAATAIHHIITEAMLGSTMHHGIPTANISDQFRIFSILENSCYKNKNYQKTKITKQDFGDKNIQDFHFQLENINWDQFLPSNAPNVSYNIFKKVSPDFYDVAFHINTPWITKKIFENQIKRKRKNLQNIQKTI